MYKEQDGTMDDFHFTVFDTVLLILAFAGDVTDVIGL
jgi:hypothetical protein